jgi:hypothetical protein
MERSAILLDQDVHVCEKVNKNYTPFVDMISLYNLLFWNMAIFLSSLFNT